VSGPFDLLQLPLLGSLLRSRHGRLAFQAASFLLLLAIVLDGLLGPQHFAHNLAGNLLWNVLRPLNLILFLLVGNFFCMACPFTFLRELAVALRLPSGTLNWPTRLRTKWIAAALLPLYLWSYLHLGLPTSPRRTALLLLAYVAAATLFNTLFRTAVFCKHLCPMGQFNFLVSRLAPLTVAVKSRRTCATCATHACIRGTATQPGCDMQLYLPQKIGNLDCTLCLHCIQACPSDNLQIAPQHPLLDLAQDPVRSSFQRLSRRLDLALLALTVTFAPLLLAARESTPIQTALSTLARRWPLLDTAPGSLLLTTLIAVTLLLLVAALTHAIHPLTSEPTARALFCRLSGAFLPLGAAFWFALLLHPVLPTLATAVVLALGLLCSLLPGVAIFLHSTPTHPKAARTITLWTATIATLYTISLYLLTP
jgi:ferredoxin